MYRRGNWGLMPSESPQSVDRWQQEAITERRNTHISRRKIQWRFTLDYAENSLTIFMARGVPWDMTTLAN
jgi:hypothetical protein